MTTLHSAMAGQDLLRFRDVHRQDPFANYIRSQSPWLSFMPNELFGFLAHGHVVYFFVAQSDF